MERKPVYVLHITLPPVQMDVNIEPAKTAIQFEVRALSLSYMGLVLTFPFFVYVSMFRMSQQLSLFSLSL